MLYSAVVTISIVSVHWLNPCSTIAIAPSIAYGIFSFTKARRMLRIVRHTRPSRSKKALASRRASRNGRSLAVHHLPPHHRHAHFRLPEVRLRHGVQVAVDDG